MSEYRPRDSIWSMSSDVCSEHIDTSFKIMTVSSTQLLRPVDIKTLLFQIQLSLSPGPLWLGVVVPDRILSISQIDLFENY